MESLELFSSEESFLIFFILILIVFVDCWLETGWNLAYCSLVKGSWLGFWDLTTEAKLKFLFERSRIRVEIPGRVKILGVDLLITVVRTRCGVEWISSGILSFLILESIRNWIGEAKTGSGVKILVISLNIIVGGPSSRIEGIFSSNLFLLTLVSIE